MWPAGHQLYIPESGTCHSYRPLDIVIHGRLDLVTNVSRFIDDLVFRRESPALELLIRVLCYCLVNKLFSLFVELKDNYFVY
jgi:hypothetical protein